MKRLDSHVHLLLVAPTERTAELARVFGIDFYSVLTRGSQFRVESMMLRLAKPMNYIAISPTKAQVAAMRAAECVPLIMEPEVCAKPILVPMLLSPFVRSCVCISCGSSSDIILIWCGQSYMLCLDSSYIYTNETPSYIHP